MFQRLISREHRRNRKKLDLQFKTFKSINPIAKLNQNVFTEVNCKIFFYI